MGSQTSKNLKESPQIQSQNELLNVFCQDVTITNNIAELPSGDLNYVEIVSNKKKNNLSSVLESEIISANGPSSITSINEKVLVLAHGYGSGLGFFYPNYSELAKQYDRVIALDWLGMGASSRSPKSGKYPKYHYLNPMSMSPTQAVDFFIDNLEEFRAYKNLTSFVLAGHSLGGYLSGRYALKYPTHLAGLVLISPVGIPTLPEKQQRVPTSELSYKLRAARSAWNNNVTPQIYVRSLFNQEAGKIQVEATLKRRFGPHVFTEEQIKLLSNYLYHITTAPPCGEYALNSILTPCVYYPAGYQRNTVDLNNVSNGNENSKGDMNSENARRVSSLMPMHSKVCVFAKESLEDMFMTQSLQIPSILIMYGDSDWLAYHDMPSSINKWKNSRYDDLRNHQPHSKKKKHLNHHLDINDTVQIINDSTSNATSKPTHVFHEVIPSAGHHIYMDNPHGFHKVMKQYSNTVYP